MALPVRKLPLQLAVQYIYTREPHTATFWSRKNMSFANKSCTKQYSVGHAASRSSG